MITDVAFIETISIILVFIGTFLLFLSLHLARKIRAGLQDAESLNKRWHALYGLIVFLLIGYLLYDLSLISDLSLPFQPVIACVFFGGAVFVLVFLRIFQTAFGEKQRAEDSLRENEACFHEIFDSVSEAIIIIDPESGAILGENRKMRQMFGLHHEEIREIGIEELITRLAPEPGAQWREWVTGGHPWVFEWIVAPEGLNRFWVEGNAHIAFINGEDRLLVSLRNVSKRKRLEERMSRLNDCFLGFSEHHQDNIMQLTRLCGELMGGVCALYSRIEGEMLHTLADWNAPADFQRIDRAEGHLCTDVIRLGGEDPFCIRNLPESSYAKSDPNVQRYGLLTYVGMAVKCEDVPVGSLCVVFQRDFAPDEEDGKFLGILASALGVEEERRVAAEALQKAHEELESRVAERTAELARVNQQLLVDMAERKKAEEALWKSEKILRKVFEAIPDMVSVIDRNMMIVHSNWQGGYEYVAEADRHRPILCYDAYYPGQGKPCKDCHAIEVFRTGKMVSREKDNPRIGRIEARAFPIFDDSGQVVMVAEYIRDITEQRRMEEELRKAQKLESLGVLAGGIAHDFNNLLTGILGNLSLAKTTTQPDSDACKKLGEAEKAIYRARDLTQQLMTFSKGGAPVKSTASIEQIVKDSASFILRGANVRCEFMASEEIWPVEVDEGQMNQVINNLMINAAQSMKQGGIIEVGFDNVSLDNPNEMGLKEGRYVKISIRDHGSGIPEDSINRVFDPYFTTKDKGSGLGLATVYSIIKNHDGFVGVESRIDEGSTFRIYLPATTKGLQKDSEEKENPPFGSGKVLVMDDEEVIRKVAAQMLKHLGYSAVVCRDGRAAIELYRAAMESAEPFSAVIMDLTIPGGMGGKETVQRLRELDKDMISIVSSGYSNDDILSNFKEHGFSGMVKKPYSLSELGRVLHELVSGERGRHRSD